MLKTFAYHSPSEKGLEKINTLRENFSKLYETVTDEVPESRERSLALTNLEQAGMWAVKAVVFNDPESEVQSEVE